MGKNVFEIWDENGRKLPFSVRRDTWGPEYCAVVEEIEIRKWPYGIARGYSARNGCRNTHFSYDSKWRQDRQIPNAGSYQWTLAQVGGSLSSLGAQLRNHSLRGISYPITDNEAGGYKLIPAWQEVVLEETQRA